MKKYLLAVALVMASSSAFADRVVSGKTGVWVDADPYASKANACESAKKDARNKAGYGAYQETVEGYSKCDCDQDSNGKWSCSVDAKLVKE